MIVAAAIKSGDGQIYSLLKPARHHDILNMYSKVLKRKVIQGFLTDRGLFLDRRTAAEEAIKCKQIASLKWPPQLYSEDLW